MVNALGHSDKTIVLSKKEIRRKKEMLVSNQPHYITQWSMHWVTKTIVLSKKEIRRKKEMLVSHYSISKYNGGIYTLIRIIYIYSTLTHKSYTHILEIFIESNLDVYIENCGTVENYIIFEYINPHRFGKIFSSPVFVTVYTTSSLYSPSWI